LLSDLISGRVQLLASVVPVTRTSAHVDVGQPANLTGSALEKAAMEYEALVRYGWRDPLDLPVHE
jgi:hypothetical protein